MGILRPAQRLQKRPNDTAKVTVERHFDEIFTQKINSDKLAEEIQKFKLHKTDLLRVLTYPFIDLHNNSSEQAIRTMVIKQKISGQTRSIDCRYARDIFASIVKTCRIHGISVWKYLGDRLRKTKPIPYLPDLIRLKANQYYTAPT